MHKIYSLDGRATSTLDWGEQIECAIGEQEPILWSLDLGLFDQLMRPLSDGSQLQTLQLAIQHFRAVCWERFQEKSLGVILYQGSIDFSAVLPIDPILQDDFTSWKKGKHRAEKTLCTLHAREVAAHYFETLAASILWEIPVYLAFDSSSVTNEIERMEWLHPDFFRQFELAFFKGEDKLSLSAKNSTIAICLPTADRFEEGKRDLEQFLIRLKGQSYRLISEATLEQDWDGVDDLYVPSCCMDHDQTARKLEGFKVAGGHIFTNVSA